MARAVYFSFCKGSPAAPRPVFIGLDNYRKMLSDPNFLNALFHNLEIMLFAGGFILVLSLAISLGLTKTVRGNTFFRVVFLFPNVMPAVATAILWSFVFNPSFGILNGFLRKVGLDGLCHAWLGEPHFALPAIMLIQVWAGLGFYIVLFYAGILRIPSDYLESARIDGASGWQEFRNVILPLLNEILKIAVVYIIINALNVFALVFLVTEGNPDRYVDVMLTYLYEQGFRNSNFGYACTIGVVMLLTLLLLAGIANRLLRREKVEL
jgi:N-acetylglucosamine transport system permease protein